MTSAISDPSESIDEINVPEVTNFSSEFVYNFYVKDERVNNVLSEDLRTRALDKIPRYIILSWHSPVLSNFERENQKQLEQSDTNKIFSIQENSSKLLSEDSSLNLRYFSHTFSDVSAIEQGASDLENYSRLSFSPIESMKKMGDMQLNELNTTSDREGKINDLLDSYSKFANFPKSSLRLGVVDSNGKSLNDEDEFIKSIAKSISSRVKIHSSILPDIFKDSKEKLSLQNLDKFNNAFANVLSLTNESQSVQLDPISIDGNNTKFKYLTQPVRITGYVLDKYKVVPTGFQKVSTFYFEDPTTTNYVDKEILYGETYFYSIRVVANVQMLLYPSAEQRSQSAQLSNLYVTSKSVTSSIRCFEFVPPPPPTGIKFLFDRNNNKFMILWDLPSNPQRDIKQYQVLRRKSIKEPFELIAQYGFDNSEVGPDGTKYITGEVIDANNVPNMQEDLKTFVKNYSQSVFLHVDEDFTIDTEFSISSDYIYALCSVDAHGMISNYSEQIQVKFDSIKNKLVMKTVCDSGSPRQYPNMNLRIETFKDVIHVNGTFLKKMQIYFTPEYLKVKDSASKGRTYNIVEAQIPTDSNSKNSFYLLQLINLNNQKFQTLKINVVDHQAITK